MNRQSLLFLDALWNTDVQKDKLLQICKESFEYEIEYELKGILRPETIWFSDEAIQKKKHLMALRSEMVNIERPSRMNYYMKDCKKIIGELQALQLLSMKNLIAEMGPTKNNSHIFVRQMIPCAIEKIREQAQYQLYRLTVLSGYKPTILNSKPDSIQSVHWFDYYKNDVCGALEMLSDDAIDGRWAYVKRDVIFGSGKPIKQYVSVMPKDDELRQAPGGVGVDINTNNVCRIFGRGYLTNLQIEDMEHLGELELIKDLSEFNVYDEISDTDVTPLRVLSECFHGKKFLISPEEYFTSINQFLIANAYCTRNL